MHKLSSSLTVFLVSIFSLLLFVGCEKEKLAVAVTNTVGSVTSSKASITIEITNDGNTTIKEIGVVYGKSVNPNLTADNKVLASGTSVGKYNIEISGLSPATTYHYRSYVTNSIGTSYGEDKTFSTTATIPTVSVSPITEIRNTTAYISASVTTDGGSPVTSRGVCWSLSANPTTADSKTDDGSGIGNYSSNLTGLKNNTTYHIRAYAINNIGTSYGDDLTFTTTNLNPIYLDANGVTIKCYDWATIGEKGIINGIEYTIVNREELNNLISSGADYSKVCTSKITDMNSLFRNKNNIQNISTWDVSNVTDMNNMFFNVSDNPNLTFWNVSKVLNMSNMFAASDHDRSSFNIDVSNWNVSRVKNMSQMFLYRSNFNRNLNKWNVGQVENMSGMFTFCDNFNGDISSWDVSNVIDMSGMFFDAYNFSSDISKWNVGKVTNMFRMFRFVQNMPDVTNWNVSSVTNMWGMFEYCSLFNQDLSKWDVSNVTEMSYMFHMNSGGIFNQDLSTWNVVKVTSCGSFSLGSDKWSLPKPKFINCNPN